MKNYKLFDLIRNISKQEFRAFGDFVESPYYNKSRKSAEFYALLLKNYDFIVSRNVSSNDIFNRLNTRKKISRENFWKLTSGLSALIDEYFIADQFRTEKYLRKNMLLESYRNRNLQKQFNSLCREVIDSMETETSKGISYFENLTHFYFQRISFGEKTGEKVNDEDIRKLFENLKMFFIITNITGFGVIAGYSSNFALSYRKYMWFFDEVLEHLKKNETYYRKKYISGYAFYLIVLCWKNFKTGSHYTRLKKTVLGNRDKFSGNLLRHILLNMLGYSLEKLRSGEEKYLKEVFLVNKIIEEHKLALYGQHIGGEYFCAVVENAVNFNEIEWTENFIKKYKDYISPEFKVSSISLSLARLNFKLKKYSQTLGNLQNIENLTPYFYINHKIISIQTFYETGSVNNIPHLISSVNKYLQRKKDMDLTLRESCGKFIYYISRLLKSRGKKNYPALKKQLYNENYFPHKKWIQEKTEEVK